VTATERKTVYEIVSEKLAVELENGNVPWQRGWRTQHGGRRPSNLISKQPYRGINVLLTGLAPYASPWWVTFKQAQSLGGSVRKGEKGTMVVYYQMLKRNERDASGTKVEKTIPLLRTYFVFNVEQCDGIPATRIPQEPIPGPVDAVEADDAADAIVAGYTDGPTVHFGGEVASYNAVTDGVRMPARDSFAGTPEFYGTFFHELVHSTGHKSRLDRLEATGFGTEPYAREELVAEIGACFLAELAGLEVTYTNSAAYLRGWASKLRKDPKAIVNAASLAQKAVERIVPVQVVEETEEGEVVAA
jgi:antirestriction protein ArdC